MKTLTQTPATPGQVKQLTRMISDIADSAEVQEALSALTKEGAEQLKGSKFVTLARTGVVEQITELSVVNQFADEEVPSKYGYLSGYKPKGLNEQCNILRMLFPGIGYVNQDLLTRIEKGEVKLPDGAEGWFAIPNWFKNPKIFGTTYSQALQTVLDKISETRNGAFVNYRAGQIDEKHIRLSPRMKKFFRELLEAQGNPDILIVPAQFGIRHRGRSVRRAIVVFSANEAGLGPFAVGIMFLTHPERLQNYDDLWIDCPGVEFDDPGSDVRFDHAFYFCFNASRVRFDANYVDDVYEGYGSASAFGSQKK